MKIAILYHTKFGNTEHISEFMAEKMRVGGHEVRIFKIKKTKPSEIISFQPEAIVVGSPTHFGKPARTLGKFIKKLGKI